MKRGHLIKIIFIMSMLCLPKVTVALFNQEVHKQSFSMFYNIPVCRSLVESYITQEGKVNPVAQASLPLEYYLHESIPKHYRPLFYDQAEAWNNTVGNEVIRINGEIDQGVFDPEPNGSDQKNVIYLVSKEDYIRILNSHGNDITKGPNDLIPGISEITPKTEYTQNDLPFLPITDSDIMIREEVLTDIGFYRNRLFANMKHLGIEGDFNDEDIEVIKSAIVNHIINMSDEDVKAFLIEDFEVEKKELEALRNIEDYQDFISDTLDEINQRIEEVQNMTHEQIRQVRINMSYNLLYVNMDIMESQSSFILQNTIRHEMGHGLGLRDYTLPDHHPIRSMNVMRPYLVEAYSQITILKEIDPFAVYGVFCLYKEYPNITDSVLNAIL